MYSFSDFGYAFDDLIETYASELSIAVIDNMTAPVTLGLTIWVLVEGYLIMTGVSRKTIPEFIWQCAKIFLIAFVGLNTFMYMTYVIDFVGKLDSWLIGMLPSVGGNAAPQDSWGALTALWGQTWDCVMRILSMKTTFSLTGMFISLIVGFTAFCAGFGVLFITNAGVTVIVANKIILVIMLGLGPLFCCLAMFQVTKFMFEGWWKTVATCLLTFVFFSAAVSFALSIFQPIVAQLEIATQSSTSGIIGQVMELCGMFIVMCLGMGGLFTWIPMLARNITGAMSPAAFTHSASNYLGRAAQTTAAVGSAAMTAGAAAAAAGSATANVAAVGAGYAAHKAVESANYGILSGSRDDDKLDEKGNVRGPVTPGGTPGGVWDTSRGFYAAQNNPALDPDSTLKSSSASFAAGMASSETSFAPPAGSPASAGASAAQMGSVSSAGPSASGTAVPGMASSPLAGSVSMDDMREQLKESTLFGQAASGSIETDAPPAAGAALAAASAQSAAASVKSASTSSASTSTATSGAASESSAASAAAGAAAGAAGAAAGAAGPSVAQSFAAQSALGAAQGAGEPDAVSRYETRRHRGGTVQPGSVGEAFGDKQMVPPVLQKGESAGLRRAWNPQEHGKAANYLHGNSKVQQMGALIRKANRHFHVAMDAEQRAREGKAAHNLERRAELARRDPLMSRAVEGFYASRQARENAQAALKASELKKRGDAAHATPKRAKDLDAYMTSRAQGDTRAQAAQSARQALDAARADAIKNAPKTSGASAAKSGGRSSGAENGEQTAQWMEYGPSMDHSDSGDN